MRPNPLVFGLAIALSAFLLFAVQPLVGRLALPAFGGAPGTWTVILATFQGALLLGYLYAHLSIRYVGRRGAVLHVGVVVAAVVVLWLAPDRFAVARDPALPSELDLLRLLLIAIGLPAVALGATTPLLSGWLVRLEPGSRPTRDPYRLYALSNLGSFVGLLVYPFVVDPLLGLRAQRTLWLGGFVVLAVLLVACALLVLRSGRLTGTERRPGSPDAPSSGRPTPARRLRWALLAAVPAGLLAAVTNFVATDLMAAPLLWVGPLGIYLLTLVGAFSGRLRSWPARLAWLAPAVVAILLVPYAAPVDWPVLPLIVLEWGGLGVIALVLHARLAADRPAADRLTEFELVIAAGGVAGGAFVGIVAPLTFPDVWEYPILLVLALAALAVADPGRRVGVPDVRHALAGATRRLTAFVGIAVVLVAALAAGRSIAIGEAGTWLLVAAIPVALAGDLRLAALAAAVIVAVPIVAPEPALVRDRSFFAVSEVVEVAAADGAGAGQVVLYHGTTVHGVRSLDPALADEPSGYFVRSGPLGDVMERLDATVSGGRRVTVVGLGAGTIAAYARPGDAFRFIEVDPLVVEIAEDRDLVGYLADAAAAVTVELDDGRLAVERSATGSVDLLILDAFASDAVPAHLLTVEALAEDVRVLAPGGLLAAQVSSRVYDLAPVIAAGLDPVGLTTLYRRHVPTDAEAAAGAIASEWVVAVDDDDVAGWFETRGWERVEPADRPLTDDRSDTLRLIRPDALL